ncbi:MAG: hypothetical protein ACYTF0_01950, partial [Planctomycetota bacterium]
MPEPVIVAVPPKGGTLDDVFKRLVGAGWIEHDLVAAIRSLIKSDKRRIKLESGLIHLWASHHGDQLATLRAAVEAGHDADKAERALRGMRRYQAEDGSTQLSFTPKAGVDAMLQELRHDGDPVVGQAAMTLHLELDCTRIGRPTRMMFDHLEFEWTVAGGRAVHGVLVGTEHEVTPTYLRRNKRDLSLTCYDAFHNTLLDALDTGKVHNWRELMDHLIEANTDVRILGSLGLDDYLGHFVLMPEERARRVQAAGGGRTWTGEASDPKTAILAEEPLLIDTQYESIYMRLLDNETNGIVFDATREDIEDACAREGRSAIYIVRSGGTIARTPGLCVVGEELVTSETIVAVNQERMEANPAVGVLIDSLAPSAEDHSAT